MQATLTQLHKLESRYPFEKREMEILIRAHDHIRDEQNREEDFLVLLALTSPFTEYFLPGDEIRDRVTWIEDHILPSGFPNRLRSAISADPFVDYANEGENKSLERLLEGVADTGRRGPREALRIFHQLVKDPSATELVDLCFRLALACDALVEPNLDKQLFLQRMKSREETIDPIVRSLSAYAKNQPMERGFFTNWAEKQMPLLSSPLSTFLHHLLFHRGPYPTARIPYTRPEILEDSFIMSGSLKSPLLFSLSLTSPHFSQKWSRLYSSENDGRSFNRLEWALLGYDGPTVFLIKTEHNAVIGGFTSDPWKDATHHFGSGECFLFELIPELTIRNPTGDENNFMYMHSSNMKTPIEAQSALPYGIGFGGSLSKPRFFVPESLQQCSVDYMDKTFEIGDILPDDELGRFEISVLEVWGVGSDHTIGHALRKRDEYRFYANEEIRRARDLDDKGELVQDLRMGYIPSKLFQHQKDVRGRHEFRVDEEHGGYKIE
eukprot:scaffold7017_cov134-Cylindrotheca_fusiformis.AAC.17